MYKKLDEKIEQFSENLNNIWTYRKNLDHRKNKIDINKKSVELYLDTKRSFRTSMKISRQFVEN